MTPAKFLLAVALSSPTPSSSPTPTPSPPPTAEEALAPCKKLLVEGPVPDAIGCARGRARHSAQMREAVIDALRDAVDTGDTLPHAGVALGTLEVVAGDERAVTRLTDAADVYAASGHASGEVHARVALARWFSARNGVQEALDQVERAYTAAGDDPILSALCDLERAMQLGTDLAGDFTTARRLLDRALERLPDDAPMSLRVAALKIAGDLASFADDPRAARRLGQARADLLGDSGNEYGRVQAQYDAMRHELALHNTLFAELPDDYLDRQRALVRDAEKIGNRWVVSVGSCTLGDLVEDPSERVELLRHCVAVRRELGFSLNFAQHVLARNLGADFPERREETLAILEEALATASEGGDPWGQAEGLSTRARLHWRWGDREEALADWERAFAAVESIRDRQADDTVKAGVFAFFVTTYLAAAGSLLAAEDPSDADVALAFDMLERMRGRVLLDAMDEAGVSRSVKIDSEVARERAATQRRATKLAEDLASGELDEAARASALGELAALDAREKTLRLRIATAQPRFARMHQPTLPSLAEVRDSLRPDEALLTFAISTDRDRRRRFLGGSWCIAVTREQVRVYRLPTEETLVPALDRFVADLAAGRGDAQDTARWLYDAVLGDALAELPAAIDHLLVVPDGAFHRLPFAALERGDGRAVGTVFGITRVLSGAMLVHARRSPGELRRDLVALADPAPATDDTELASLPRLPGARIEAAAAAETIGEHSVAYEDGEASEERLHYASASGVSMLHVGAHAVVNATDPEQTLLVLAPDEANDGRAHLAEIADSPRAPELVVLAACQSAEGNLLGGDGLLGPAQAFSIAGTRTVIASLWPLADDDAVRFFTRFYARLDEGATVTDAVAATRRELATLGHPAAAWAGIVAIGDGDLHLVARPEAASPLDATRLRRIGSAAFAFIAALALLLFARSRRRPPQTLSSAGS